MSKLKLLRKLMFALPLSEANFEVRGFEASPAQARLELVAKTVVHGYNTAIETGNSSDLLTHRELVTKELKGFYNEGIGMGLYTIDLFSASKKSHFWDFVRGVGKDHEYMSYIGAGIACGVFFERPFKEFLDLASPTSGLLILNGYGFYYAYFKPDRIFKKNFIPKAIQADPFYIECYDNGIGRALWFYNGGNPDKIAKSIATFPVYRQPWLWAGVGLAATYAGGVSPETIRLLKELAGKYAVSLGEGSLLATHTRDIAKNPHEDDSTVRILTGRTAKECTEFGREAIEKLGEKRWINNKHSLLVFFEDIRQWLKKSDIPVVRSESMVSAIAI